MFRYRLMARLVASIMLCFALISPHDLLLASTLQNQTSARQLFTRSQQSPVVAQISLQETVSTDGTCAVTNQISVLAGSAVTFCFRITNTGTTILTSHSLTDNVLGSIFSGQSINLTPGQTHVVTRTTVVTQSLSTNALWEASGIGGTATAQSGSVVVAVQAAQITFAHTVGPAGSVGCPTQKAITITLDASVVHCYSMTNTGPITLTHHQITDTVLGTLESNLLLSIAPGANSYITRIETPTSAAVHNSRWSASTGVVTVTASSSVAVNVILADITLEQTVGVDPSRCAVRNSIDVGQNTPITFCYVVRNTGTVPFTLHELSDTDSGQVLTGLAYVLNPSTSGFITRTTTLAQSTINRATWIASNGVISVQASSIATVTVQPAAIIMSMGVGYNQFDCTAANAISVPPYTDLVFCYGIRNSGALPLTIHTITDDQLGVVKQGLNQTVAPGATLIVTKSATVVQSHKHVGTWFASNGVLTTTSSAFANVEVTPISLALFVTVGADGTENCASTSSVSVPYGAKVTYCYTIRNISGITLTKHNLSDSQYGQVLTDLPYSLPAGASAFITTTVPSTRTLVNTATWTATDGRATAIAVGSASVKVYDQVIYVPEIFYLHTTR